MFLRALLFLATFLFLISFEVKAEMINLLCVSDDTTPEELKTEYFVKIDTTNKSGKVGSYFELTRLDVSENRIKGFVDFDGGSGKQGGMTGIFDINRVTGVMQMYAMKNINQLVRPTQYFNCIPAKAKF